MYNIIDGKTIAAEIKEELKLEIATLKTQGITCTLAVVMVGNDKASAVYVRNKERACEYIGIESRTILLEESISQQELLATIDSLNEDQTINGILVQLPLPKHLVEKEILERILPTKDVDSFHPYNVGKLCSGEKTLVSCTPAGIIELLKRSHISIEGKECVVVGRSNIVGKPCALLLLEENATVTIAHSRTKNLAEITKRADILIVAVGKPLFITKEYVKDGAVVVDVGIHRDETNHLCGDVDFENVKDIVSAITPVPGGVGPMTIVTLMKNCIVAAKLYDR